MEKHIRQSHSLCAGEQEYVHKRKQVVLESLNNLGVNCKDTNSVPNIAFLGSGGGQRAAVALMGSLHQMKQDDLLDTLLYLGGVSGSSWSMSTLYKDPQWSNNMDRAVSRLSGSGMDLKQVLAWLIKRSVEEQFSLTDIWGGIASARIMKQLDERHLSDEANRDATNPYPVYCAVEKYCLHHGPEEGKWFEVSPHEAGFTELGVFVKTFHLGSRFENGTLLEVKSEMDMVKLQGITGSAMADEDTDRSTILRWLHEMIKCEIDTIQNPWVCDVLEILNDKVNQKKSLLLRSNSAEESKRLFEQWSQELLHDVEIWSQSLEEGRFKMQVQWMNVPQLIKQVIDLILKLKWEWGTTRNFLYKYQDHTIPQHLTSEQELHLIDAGLMMNVGYPSFLGDKRDIDLIIAPDYSAGNMFETLTLARDYAAKLKRPFPEIGEEILQEKEWPKDCYVFEGKEKEPTIIYMPLFNRKNCKDPEEFKAKMDEFCTFQLPYNQEKINILLEMAKKNMKNNKETLMGEINKAALRRQKKMESHQDDSAVN